MASFYELTQTENNEHHKKIFEILAQHENELTQDGIEAISLDSSEIGMIRDSMYDVVKDGLAENGEFQSASEMRESMLLKTKENVESFIRKQKAEQELFKNKGIVQDGYQNSVSGIGTYIDPGMKTESFIPVSMTPTEATSYYANGGLPARIIDKKAGCLLLQGLKFKCSKFSSDDLTKLEEYADKCGFTEAFRQGVTDSLIFGGSVCYPVFAGDNPLTMQKSKREILETLPEKDFIKYWVNVDRWNVVFVPEYNITAQDYLYSRLIFIPLGGYRLNTSRCAMIRPRKLPFWGAIQQMGWATSDFEGWIKDYESYQIMKMSLPIMAQQMSLMYHSFPADGLIIENGAEYTKQFFKQNEKEMREWSMLHPKAINSIGEIKILERTYSGFQQLITESRLALSSACSIPQSILFAEQSTGLATDNKDDIELKQSESIRLLFNNVAPSFKNCIEMLVYSCFGKNSEQAKYARDVEMSADNGTVLSDLDKAQLGQSFSGIFGTMVSAGTPIKPSIEIARLFVPSVELSQEILASIDSDSEEENGVDENLMNHINGLFGDSQKKTE